MWWLEARFQEGILVILRAMAVFMVAPVFGARVIPARFRLGAGILVGSAVWAGLPHPEIALSLYDLALAAAREILIGAAMGFIAACTVAIAEIAGAIADTQIGYRAGTVLNPLSATPSAVLEQFAYLLACCLFLSVDGHHWLISAVRQSFDECPPGALLHGGQEVMAYLIELAAHSLRAGVRVAMPITAATILVDVVLAVLSRVVPQLQVFFVGLPLKVGVGLAVLTLSWGAWTAVLRGSFEGIGATIVQLVRMLAGSA